jgi:hypothetical protein
VKAVYLVKSGTMSGQGRIRYESTKKFGRLERYLKTFSFSCCLVAAGFWDGGVEAQSRVKFQPVTL